MNGRKIFLALIMAGTAGLMAASVAFTKRQATAAYQLLTARTSEDARRSLQQALDDHVDALGSLSRGLEAAPPVSHAEYRELAVRTATRAPAFAAVNFLNHRFIETFLFPSGANSVLEGMDLKTRADALPAAHRAVSTRKAAATDLVPLAQGGEGFLAYAPVRRQDRWEGLVEGALDSATFTGRYVAPTAPAGYDVSLLSESDDAPFFTTAASRNAWSSPYSFYFTLGFADRRWWVVMNPRTWPSPLVPLAAVMLLELGLGVLLGWKVARKI